MVCWHWNHTSCSDFLVTILKASLSFSFISILFHFFPLSFFKPATFKECELPICSDQAEARPDVTCNLLNGKQTQGMQPSAICWCRKQQGMPGISTGLPRWEIEREKAFVLFFPFPDLTAPLSKGGGGGREDILPWNSDSLYLNVEHLISVVVRNAADWQILFFQICNQFIWLLFFSALNVT